jgi:hypothetical protein
VLVHLLWEARVGGSMQFRWMYSQERELKKLRYTVLPKLSSPKLEKFVGCLQSQYQNPHLSI